MQTLQAASVAEFHTLVIANLWRGTLFRGVQDAENHKLIPSVGRFTNSEVAGSIPKEDLGKVEREALQMFSSIAPSHLAREIKNELEQMTIAQHHGLPTRLLDWTFNPLVGLFFACSGNYAADGAVFAIRNTDIPWFQVPEHVPWSPFELDQVYAFLPYHISNRISPQASVFTIHPDPTEPFESEHLVKIIIPAGEKHAIEEHLSWCGIHPQTLFPGLDGICSNVKRSFFAPRLP